MSPLGIRRLLRPEPVDCDTCLDKHRVSRIRGGVRFTEPCPDEYGDPDWNYWTELYDDMRRGK